MTDSQTASAGDRRLRLCHRAEPGQLRQIRRRVETWARAWGMPADALVDLQLALGEAVANGVEHAYPDDRSGTVEVDLDVHRGDTHGGDTHGGDGHGGQVVTARVADHGTWRPAAEHTGHRGRGLLMIDRLARRVSVERRPWGTEVCFEIPFAARPVG